REIPFVSVQNHQNRLQVASKAHGWPVHSNGLAAAHHFARHRQQLWHDKAQDSKLPKQLNHNILDRIHPCLISSSFNKQKP
ncbi:MAG: hypothetical protein AAFV25_28195, partial [Bacteroidota bacterium]